MRTLLENGHAFVYLAVVLNKFNPISMGSSFDLSSKFHNFVNIQAYIPYTRWIKIVTF